MKIVAKPIRVLAVFEYQDKERPPIPYKFKMYEDSGEEILVTVDKCFHSAKSKVGGVESIVYECQSIIRGVEKRYELKYIIPRCTWQLYKI